ncbi:MAG: hypothetical protein MPL62_04200 [Alphaproteobacteria bacterium]|nr:hypothetical protein [Alphaproteobacteria bacterium]
MSRRGRTGETKYNYALEEIFKRNGWSNSGAEETGIILGSPGAKPDVWLDSHSKSGWGRGTTGMIIVETEYHHAGTLEGDVAGRLGLDTKFGPVTAVIGVVLPERLKNLPRGGNAKKELLRSGDLRYFVRFSDGGRFPEEGMLSGAATDVVNAASLVSLPESYAAEWASKMNGHIGQMAGILGGLGGRIKAEIMCLLRESGPSGAVDAKSYERMLDNAMKTASLILFNAGVFYEELAGVGSLEGVRPMAGLKFAGRVPLEGVASAWNRVLAFNYSPVFESAVRILDCLTQDVGSMIMDYMLGAISDMMASRTSKSGHVYGMLYQELLGDRADAGAYYTKPEAAALLATMVLPGGGDGLWRDAGRIRGLRIADFACGSGMLLTSAYQHVINNYAGDPRMIHRAMIEGCLYGCDIMPTATHLTVSALASAYPGIMIGGSRIYQLNIGRVAGTDGSYDLGALDLIKGDSSLTDSGARIEGRGSVSVRDVGLGGGSCDYILMNPPFKTHGSTGGPQDRTQSPFAVFGICEADRAAMRDLSGRLFRGTCASGLAGLGSHFLAISDRMLKPGGVMGLVLPGGLLSGHVWGKARRLLNLRYDGITLVLAGTSAGRGGKDLTFSADTGMNEVILVARKRDVPRGDEDGARIRLVLLDDAPGSRIEAVEIARIIRGAAPRRLEDGMGPSHLRLGGRVVGRIVSCPVRGGRWVLNRASNVGLLQAADDLASGRCGIPMSVLGAFGRVGRARKDIVGGIENGRLRGPFDVIPFTADAVPALWHNDAKTQQGLLVGPDASLERKEGAGDGLVRDVLATATRLHINQQCRFTSQRLTAAFTAEATVGGRGWMNFILDEKYEKALAVFCNSTPGILSYWHVSGTQQHGRGHMNNTRIRSLPVLDVSRLGRGRLGELDRLFDRMCRRRMRPINELDADPARRELDEGMMGALGEPDLDIGRLRRMIAAEPHFGRAGGAP